MTSIDDPALDELVARARHSQRIDSEQLGALVDELRARRIQAVAEARLRTNQAVLMGLVRSQALGRGDLDQALREITEAAATILAVGRVSVWRCSEERDSLVCIERHHAEAGSHEPEVELRREHVPAYFEAVLDGQLIAADDAPADPRTAELSPRYLSSRGIRSMLIAPILIADRVFGVICGEQLGTARSWSTYDEHFVTALADFTILAIESYWRFQTKEQLREAVETAEQRLQTIERQRVAIADLSAPIIDVWDGVLVVPIVGIVDSQRSQELTERLLDRVASSQARSVIVDLTGVEVIDTMTANHLLQMLRAARLLAADCVLSGISPQIAQTLVQLEVDLSEVATVRHLAAALMLCLRQRARAR